MDGELPLHLLKELDALDDTVFKRIDRKILALADNPRPAGCKKLKGFKDQWRIRAGDWRVLYIIDAETKTVSGSSGRGTDHCRSSGTF
jgi:mRNA interferase RelE/StbE